VNPKASFWHIQFGLLISFYPEFSFSVNSGRIDPTLAEIYPPEAGW